MKFWVRKYQKSIGPSTISVSQLVIFNQFGPTTRIIYFDKLKVVFDKKNGIRVLRRYLLKIINYETGMSHGLAEFLRVPIQKLELFQSEIFSVMKEEVI